MCLPLSPSPALQTQVLSTLQTAAPSTEAARSAFPIARGSCVNWSVSIQLTSSSPRTRGARSQRLPASQSARSPSGFRTEGSRKRRSSPRSRPALLREGAPWLRRWVGRMRGILGIPGACQGQAGAQNSAEGPPEVTLFLGHGSCAVPQRQPEHPLCPRELVRPRVTAQSTRVTPPKEPVPVIIIHPDSGNNHHNQY